MAHISALEIGFRAFKMPAYRHNGVSNYVDSLITFSESIIR